MTRLARFLFALTFVFAAALLRAQSVHWEPPSGTLAYNQTGEIQLVFDDCEPKEDNPVVPAVPGLQMRSVGQSRNMSVVNGRVSQSVSVTFHVRATQKSAVKIPPFSIETNRGRIQVPAATYDVGDATVGPGNVSLDAIANSKFDAPPQVWAGEVFKLEYTLTVGRRYFHSAGSAQPDWNPSPLAVEEWSKPDLTEALVSGEPRINIAYHTRASLKQPGTVTLNAATQLVNLTTGSSNFGFFSRPNLEQYAITSSRPTITVRELPAGAPANFNGAVGQFKLESKVVPASSAVGEPITWTLTLSGTGNWPDINGLPARDVSRDFRVVQPQARRTLRDGTLFEGTLTEDVVLIPTQPGNYTLGPVTWTYFDPAKGEYRTVTTEKVSVTVTAPAAAATPASGATATGTESGGPQTTTIGSNVRPATPPSAPQAIPRDALEGSELVARPWSPRVFTWALLSPIPVLLALWVALALRRARATDPLRPQREARARLRETLAQLKQTSDRERINALLRAWQHDSAVLWQLRPATPAPRHFEALAQSDPSSGAAAWATLWSESERALYRAQGALPSDWVSRAENALDAKAVPSFSMAQLFRGGNLLPFAAALALASVALPRLVADTGKTAYDRGDFSAAESTWRTAVSQHGNDWIARHNLALALAQQNRWGEASAYAVSAFVQNPASASARWNLNLVAERAGFTPGSLSGFLSPTPLHSIARLLSPAEWQRALVGAVALAALGAALFLLQAYGLLGRWSTAVALACLSLAVILGVLGSFSWSAYQESRDIRAAMVWKPTTLRSIPTEADVSQKTSPLAAGTIAIIDKTFLTWYRLEFSNGQTGWVRQDDLVRLWE